MERVQPRLLREVLNRLPHQDKSTIHIFLRDRQKGKVLSWKSPASEDASRALTQTLRGHTLSFERERSQAPSLTEELLRLDPTKRIEALGEKSQRFHTYSVSQELLQRCREISLRDPREGRRVAELSLAICQRLEGDPYSQQIVRDLCARAWSEIANTFRLTSEFEQAEQSLRKAAALLESSLDPLEKARVLDLEASLRRDQRRFEEALSLRDQALKIYRRFEDLHGVGRTLQNIGSDHLEMGEPEKAVRYLREAIEFVDPEIEPRTVWAVHTNLTTALVQQERFLEAAEAYSKSRDLYIGTDPATSIRQHWLYGRIATGLGRLEEAVQAFQLTREAFRQRDTPYDFAMVSLELAQVYARLGHTSEVKRLASEMVPFFKSRHIHREALAALTLFRQAAESEAATVERLQQIFEQLQKAPRKA